MVAGNFPASLGFVWRPGFDDPAAGFHVTPDDPGGGTIGGVIQSTWDRCVRAGVVAGNLSTATEAQLCAVLHAECWGSACDALPDGLDFLLFNGRMMTGKFAKIFQQCLGFMGDDVDGEIGPETLVTARSREPETMIDAVSGTHVAYLATLDTWPKFGHGWTIRIKAAQAFAIGLADVAPTA